MELSKIPSRAVVHIFTDWIDLSHTFRNALRVNGFAEGISNLVPSKPFLKVLKLPLDFPIVRSPVAFFLLTLRNVFTFYLIP